MRQYVFVSQKEKAERLFSLLLQDNKRHAEMITFHIGDITFPGYYIYYNVRR